MRFTVTGEGSGRRISVQLAENEVLTPARPFFMTSPQKKIKKEEGWALAQTYLFATFENYSLRITYMPKSLVDFDSALSADAMSAQRFKEAGGLFREHTPGQLELVLSEDAVSALQTSGKYVAELGFSRSVPPSNWREDKKMSWLRNTKGTPELLTFRVETAGYQLSETSEWKIAV